MSDTLQSFPPLMTLRTFCALTGTSRSQVYKDIDAGRLRVVKHGSRTKVTGEEAARFVKALEESRPI